MYVVVIGSYDQCVFGPMPSRKRAELFVRHIKNERNDAYVMTNAELQANFKEFGELPIEPVDYQR